MGSSISRRDFMKLAGLLPLSLAAPRPRAASAGQPNIIVVVFDAWSAYHLPLHGYARNTTPNLNALAKRAIVYHNHYAASNFTTSGTASLLTGTLPWTHRAIQGGSRVAEKLVAHNLFQVFEDYYSTAYTHNAWVDILLKQFQPWIDQLTARGKLYLAQYDAFVDALFGNDEDIASVGWSRNIQLQDGYSYSLFLSGVYKALRDRRAAQYEAFFPRGLPRPSHGAGGEFLLETAIDWTGKLVTGIPQPFLAYFHFLPPHDPYNTSAPFFNRFRGDGYEPLPKPSDSFIGRDYSEEELRIVRRQYDEYILYVDREFQRFYDALRAAGLLENTWLLLTSDHGELMERGVKGHGMNVLYEPLLRVPMLIFEPGRTSRLDVHEQTSALDLLPTLAHLTGHAIPAWAEGRVMPPFAAQPAEGSRPLYAVRAVWNSPDAPLTEASAVLVRGRYKLHYYFGYPTLPHQRDLVKLYDVVADPEEMTDLSESQAGVATSMLVELRNKLDEVNQPYL